MTAPPPIQMIRYRLALLANHARTPSESNELLTSTADFNTVLAGVTQKLDRKNPLPPPFPFTESDLLVVGQTPDEAAATAAAAVPAFVDTATEEGTTDDPDAAGSDADAGAGSSQREKRPRFTSPPAAGPPAAGPPAAGPSVASPPQAARGVGRGVGRGRGRGRGRGGQPLDLRVRTRAGPVSKAAMRAAAVDRRDEVAQAVWMIGVAHRREAGGAVAV
jgi:hypothetical protein